MGERATVRTKAPEAQRENQAAHSPKHEMSQSGGSRVEQLLFLLRTVGNQSVQRLLIRRTPAPPTFHDVTGVRDSNRIRIDAVNDFIPNTYMVRAVGVQIAEPAVKHMMWELY